MTKTVIATISTCLAMNAQTIRTRDIIEAWRNAPRKPEVHKPHANAIVISSLPYTMDQTGQHYTLSGNLTCNSFMCFNTTANNVTLDCAGATVTATSNVAFIFQSLNTIHFSLLNCMTAGAGSTAFNITGGSAAVVKGNVFKGQGAALLQDHPYAIIGADFNTLNPADGNFFSMQLSAINVDQMGLVGNQVVLDHSATWSGCYVVNGSDGPVWEFNSCKGGWDKTVGNCPGGNPCGTDDGYILGDVNHGFISYNWSQDTFDTCIEPANMLANTTIVYNDCDNARFVGYASYHYTNEWNNHWYGNTVSRTPALFTFYRSPGEALRGCPINGGFTCPETTVWYQGNTFYANSLVELDGTPIPAATWSMGAGYTSSSIPPASAFQIGGTGNCIAGNPAGSTPFACTNTIGTNFFNPFGYQPFVIPASGYTDGGGNVCGTVSPLGSFPWFGQCWH